VDRLGELLLTFWPDIILTHWFDDMHPDHEASFQILRRALLRACLDAAADDLGTFPRTFCCDTYHSRGLHGEFIPDRYVDITEVWEAKLSALKAHKSQYLSHYVAMISGQGANHGRATGTAWAEGFVYVPLYGRQDEGPPLGRSYFRNRLPQAPGTDTGASPDNLVQ
jgi:N-acetylglucosamine malate deacetylase 1